MNRRGGGDRKRGRLGRVFFTMYLSQHKTRRGRGEERNKRKIQEKKEREEENEQKEAVRISQQSARKPPELLAHSLSPEGISHYD